MPPKKRNSHLKTVRLSKKLKNENDQNTFPYEEPFDLEQESNDIINNTINLHEADNNFDEALRCLKSFLKNKNLPNVQQKRGSIIGQYYNLRLTGKKKMEASLLLSKGLGCGEYRARLIRNW